MSIQGKVKWFSDLKGYGYITPDDGTPDVFVHHSVIQGDGYRTLAESQPVHFDLTPSDRGPKAVHVVKL